MRIDFTKMHGLGNDFIVFEAPAGGRAAHRRAVAPPVGTAYRHWFRPGAGARSRRAATARGLLPHLQCRRQRGRAVWQRRALHRRPPASPRQASEGNAHHGQPGGTDPCARAGRANRLRRHGRAEFRTRSLPFDASSEAHVYPLAVAGTEVEIGAVSMGNPHAVLTVASVARAPVDRLGPAIETHTRFPKRVNVGFMEMRRPHAHPAARLRARRGETLACGTGACAAVAVGRRPRTDSTPTVAVELPGGKLEITWAGPANTFG